MRVEDNRSYCEMQKGKTNAIILDNCDRIDHLVQVTFFSYTMLDQLIALVVYSLYTYPQ